MRVLFGDRETLKPVAVSNLGRYRYKVFVLVTVSPMGVERLLAWAGFSWVRAGHPLRFGDDLVVAGYIDVA